MIDKDSLKADIMSAMQATVLSALDLSAVVDIEGTADNIIRKHIGNLRPVATVDSWANGSYHRNYQISWNEDVEVGVVLYARV